METPSTWNVSHQEFYLIGFTNLKDYRPLLFIPFFIMFMFNLVTNLALILIIIKQQSLHAPMYILIAAIACLDISVPILFVPWMMNSFLFNMNSISRVACLVQMYLIDYAGTMQSTILAGMSLDRYFAIIHPLRYSNYVNVLNSLLLTLLFLMRNTAIVSLRVGLVGTLTFCSSNVLYHCFCEHSSVVSLACGDTSRNKVAGVLGFSIPTMDCVIIAFSYCIIFFTIFKSASGESRQKAIHTCTTHLMVICLAYFSALIVFVGYRTGNAIPIDIRVLSSLLYLLIPGCCNPVIYGIRAKEIRVHLAKLVRCGKVDAV